MLVDALASYVPTRILRELVIEPAAPTEPRMDRFRAAALFADISGSAALAERLAERGPQGAEALSHVLNAYFAQLIELIAAHGGDVAKFAGDGLLALWPATVDTELTVQTVHAAQCALAIQAALHDYAVGAGIRLSMRVGVGAGEVVIVYVGGVAERWEFLVAGVPIGQVCGAQKQAQPGRAVLAQGAWGMVQDVCTGRRLPSGDVELETVRGALAFRRLEAPQVAAGAEGGLRAFAPGAILARLAAGQTEWLAELRRVSVLFVNLPQLHGDTQLERIQAVFQILQNVLQQYEGSIGRLGVEDRGPTLLAAFGLPPLAHADDAVRAVRAALAIQTALRDAGVSSAIGIATGRAFCGAFGNERRREYTIIGAVANLAARLMQAAPDGILCDTATFQGARGQCAFETLAAIAVKGKPDPVPVYRPCHPVPSAVRAPTALVGRRLERNILTQRLHATVHDAESGIVLIEGEPGIGKSRLVEDICQQARDIGLTALIGAGDAIEATTPYNAWRAVFHHLLVLDHEPDDLEARRGHVLHQLESMPLADETSRSALLRFAPLLNAVLPVDLPENAFTARMVGQVRSDNTQELLLRLLQIAASVKPLLVALEDAHWMDSASWELTRLVSQRVHPVLLVVATRPLSEPQPAEYRQLLHTAGAQRLVLDALSSDDTAALVCQRLGVRRVPESVATLIREKAGGHPFFSEELAYALRDAGQIVIVDGECRIAPDADDLTALNLPDTVQGVITGRIDRLSPEQQLVLKVASVVGRVFSLRVVRDIHPIEAAKAQLPADLDTLSQLDLTPVDTEEPDLAYVFKHIITQEVAYNLMAFSQRRQLHRAVAEWYERTYADDVSPFYPLLAHHWSKAVDVEGAEPFLVSRALDNLERAGEQALTRYANPEAVRFFTDALALMDEHDRSAAARRRRGRSERQLGEAYYRLGKAVEARQHLQRALVLTGHSVPATNGRLAVSLWAQIGRQMLHRLLPARFVERVPAERRPRVLEAVRAFETLAVVSLIATEQLPSMNGNFHALNLAEAAGPSPELARAYASIGLVAGIVSLSGVADRYFQRALDTAQTVGDQYSLAWVSFWRGYYLTGQCRWREGSESLRRALDILDAIGDRRWWEQCLLILGTLTYNRSRFAESFTMYTDAQLSAQRRGDVQAQAWAMVAQALDQLMVGQPEVALATLQTLETWLANSFVPLADRAAQINFYGIRALAHLRRDERPQAQAAAQAAGRLIEETSPYSYYGLTGYGAAAEVSLALWESADSSIESDGMQRLATHSCVALRKFARSFPLGQPQAWLWQGLHAWLCGRVGRAHTAWRKSLEAAERLQMPYEQGMAHYEIGRHLSAHDPARQRHLQRACEIFIDIGTPYTAAKAHAALAAGA